MNGAKGARFDPLSIKANIAPIRCAVPLWAVLGTVSLHGLINGHTTPFGQLMSNPDLPDGFLFPPRHGFGKGWSVMNAPFFPQGKNHESCGLC